MFEVKRQFLDLYGDLVPFLESNSDFTPATCWKLLSILNDPQQNQNLMVELAVMIDAGME